MVLRISAVPPNFSGILLFNAPWAGDACVSVRQVLAGLSFDAYCEVEEDEAVSPSPFDQFRVEVVPTLLALSNGVETNRVVGSNPTSIISFIEQFKSSSKSSNPIASTENLGLNSSVIPSTLSLESRLKELISTAPLMLFIKGTPTAPQCGFTGQLIRLLSENGLYFNQNHYATFNILADSQVRQGLKDYSQWPTFPQIYWKGELLGGLDILKEMIATQQMEPIISEIMNQ